MFFVKSTDSEKIKISAYTSTSFVEQDTCQAWTNLLLRFQFFERAIFFACLIEIAKSIHLKLKFVSDQETTRNIYFCSLLLI